MAHSEETNKQSLANRLARSSCEALACLAGFREQTPDNDGVQNSLRALLTPYVCKLMRTTSNDEVCFLIYYFLIIFIGPKSFEQQYRKSIPYLGQWHTC